MRAAKRELEPIDLGGQYLQFPSPWGGGGKNFIQVAGVLLH